MDLGVEVVGGEVEGDCAVVDDGETLRVTVHPGADGGAQIRVTYRAVPRRGLYFLAPDEHVADRPRQVWTQCQDEDARHIFPCHDKPHVKQTTELRVKVRDRNRMGEATEELAGAVRRARGQLPGERDNFSVNQSDAIKAQLDPIKSGIAIAGLLITGLSLIVGAIGIANITFVSVKERTKEIGTRKALGARRRTILLQFLIEAVAISLAGGLVGLGLTYGIVKGVEAGFPALPVQFPVMLIFVGMGLSVLVGVLSGFIPAWLASRLDPVVALRYE